MNRQTAKYRDFVLLALFAAIILLLAFTPIGYIQLPIIKATIVHVPVILGAIILGPKKGAILGVLFGLTSFISNTFMPTALSFAFSPAIPLPGTPNGSIWSLFICFVPRILVGVFAYYVFALCQKLMKKSTKGEFLSLAIGALVGSFTNTILVMGASLSFLKMRMRPSRASPQMPLWGPSLPLLARMACRRQWLPLC
ncbi:MAG: ECF transporter S component [Anaeromassilibacillus sp.]